MNRKKINFPEALLEKLEKRKREKGFETLSPCVVEMLEEVFQREEKGAVSTNPFSSPPSAPISPELGELLAIKKMLVNTSAWVMESRLRNRYLVENMSDHPKEKGVEMLQRFKERAHDFVKRRRTDFDTLLFKE